MIFNYRIEYVPDEVVVTTEQDWHFTFTDDENFQEDGFGSESPYVAGVQER